jgi:hypothetical protein
MKRLKYGTEVVWQLQQWVTLYATPRVVDAALNAAIASFVTRDISDRRVASQASGATTPARPSLGVRRAGGVN